MSEQNSSEPDSITADRVEPSLALGYSVAVSASRSSVRTTLPVNQSLKIASYSPESTIAVIATLRASRSSPESSRTARPKVSSENVVIRVPDSASTGASPIA